jgi:hypothetical protein
MWIMWKTCPPSLWISEWLADCRVDNVENLSTELVDKSPVRRSYVESVENLSTSIVDKLKEWTILIKTKRSGNTCTKINKLSTFTVDNLVNKCVEVMKMYSDRKCLSGETYSHMRQQFVDAHYFTRAKGRCQMDMCVLGCIAVVHGTNSAEHIGAQLFAEAI